MQQVKCDRPGWCLSLWWRGAFLGITLAALIDQSAQADLVISVDLDPVTPGIQNTLSVQQGQVFNANLVLAYNDPVGLDSYWFSVQFNNSGLSYTSSTSIALASFAPQAGLPGLTAPNTIAPFEAASNDPFIGPISVPATIVGTVTFTAGMSLGNFAISPFEDFLFDGSFRNDFSQINPVTFNSGSILITAVPEPSSLALVMLAAVLITRRNRSRYV